jgi:hypothetical protein
MLVLAAYNGDDSFRLCGTLIGEASGDTCEDNIRFEFVKALERPLGALHVLCRNKHVNCGLYRLFGCQMRYFHEGTVLLPTHLECFYLYRSNCRPCSTNVEMSKITIDENGTQYFRQA